MEPSIPPPTASAPMGEGTKRRVHRVLLVALAVIAVVIYALFNVWVYRYGKSGGAPTPKKIWQTVTEQGAGFGGFQGKAQGRIPTPTSRLTPTTPAATPTPTPRPAGPGPFACAPDGTCNSYGEDMRKQNCPVTFADSRCLDSCTDAAKRCRK